MIIIATPSAYSPAPAFALAPAPAPAPAPTPACYWWALFSVESSKKHHNLACRHPETTEGKTAHKPITKPNSSQLRLTQRREGQPVGYDKTTKTTTTRAREKERGRAAAAEEEQQQRKQRQKSKNNKRTQNQAPHKP
jgi:hypothetical protein